MIDSELASYQGLVDQSDKGPIKSRLYDIIDANRDGKITPAEIRAALAKPWHAQFIAQLITRHESEWFWNPEKWNALDDLMGHSPSDPNPAWVTEKERIQKLCWWSDLAGKHGICGDGKVWHFQPLKLISQKIDPRKTFEELIIKIGKITSHGEGNYESYNTGTKHVPEGRVGFSFWTNPTGTITRKTINEIISTDHLPGTDRRRMFATGKHQTTIPTLREAKAKLKLSGEEPYTPELQEKIFREFLFEKAGGGKLSRFVKLRKGTKDDAQYAASKEWASLAAPADFEIKDGRISDGTLSYYESEANTASQKSTKILREILSEIENSHE